MIKFMVVDDSNVIREKISNVLTTPEYAGEFELVGSASDGVEAVEQFKLLKPKIVTMDITMPRMEGVEAIEKLLEHDPDVRVLVISALADKATLIKAMHKGAYGLLCKPFTDLTLTDAIYELIEDLNND